MGWLRKVNDIDWAEGRLIIRAGKNHRERSLPLLQIVGEALVAYLQQARPRTSPYREIFLRWYPPFRPLRSSCTISALVGKVLKRARVEVNRPGAHVFRHTLEGLMCAHPFSRRFPVAAIVYLQLEHVLVGIRIV